MTDLITTDLVRLGADWGSDKQEVIRALAGVVDGAGRASDVDQLVEDAFAREATSPTGLPGGIAIPHCRSLVVNRLRLAYGRKPNGVDFKAIDGAPVHNFFLIVAPPLEVSNQYLPVLGKIAQFGKDPSVPMALSEMSSPQEFLALLEQKAP